MSLSRISVFSVVVGAGLCGVSGCGGAQQVTAQGTSIAPGASAEISVGKSEGTQMVELDVQHLAPPERLGAGLTQYAVWVVPTGMSPILAGRLAYDRDSQRGQIRATTPHEVFEIVVSAEGESIGQMPSRIVVLHRGVRTP